MLQDIRDKSQGIVVKIIVGFIVITFALFGVDALVTGFVNTDTVAEVDGTEITSSELLQMSEIQRRQLISAMGAQINPALLEDNLLQRRALEELIQRAVLVNNAEKQKLSISDNQVNRYLLNAEQFQTDGQFDQSRYLEFIRSLGYTPLTFRNRIKQDLLLQQSRNALANMSFVLDNEIDLVSKLQNQQRSYEYIRLSLAKEVESANVSDAEIEEYFSENSNDFMLPEQVKLDYIVLSSVDFQKNVTVTDSELQAAYQNAIATQSPEERLASHVLIETSEDRNSEDALALANELKAKIDANAEFADIAKEYSDDLGSKASGGDLGYITSGNMPSEFDDALFSMNVNQVSDVVETEFGYHIIQLREVVSSKAPTYESMVGELRQTLIEGKARQAMSAAREDITDLAYASDNLDPIAEEYGVSVAQSDWFGRQGGNEVISANSEIVAASFSSELLEDGLNSDLIELNEEQVAVVRKNDYKPAAAQPFAEAKNEILATLLNEKASKNLAAKADKLKSDATAKGWESVDAVSRGADEITTLAFDLAHPEPEPTLAIKSLNDGDLVVIKLKQVIEGEVSGDEIQRSYIERYLTQSHTELFRTASQQALSNLSTIERQ